MRLNIHLIIRFFSFVLLLFCSVGIKAQIDIASEFPELFKEVQTRKIFHDSKTFVDCIPAVPPDTIRRRFVGKSLSDQQLKDFVLGNFLLPEAYDREVISKPDRPIKEHINYLWDVLVRDADTVYNSSLIPLPHDYVVPGGRFREIYYWDSYFTMLGLIRSMRSELANNMVDNFAFLIDQYGYIPNGNRTYYLSRSQPPFFALMVELLAESQGEKIVGKYLPQLVREYAFWTDGIVNPRKVIMPDGEVLNRYWDNSPEPRPESYVEDLELTAHAVRFPSKIYRDIRAACESGWDFSSRWLLDKDSLSSINTTDILPVDLNCLLYKLELMVSRGYKVRKDKDNAKKYELLANARKQAINKYFWDKEARFYMDHAIEKQSSTGNFTLAAVYPLYFQIADKNQAKAVMLKLEEDFLKPGGLLTTLKNSGQQWDAPNGWAPLQYMAIKGLQNYGHKALAKDVSAKWMSVVEKVYQNTGKIMEKYNVEDITLEAGGGEYPAQDGFGWTNGVYLMLSEMR